MWGTSVASSPSCESRSHLWEWEWGFYRKGVSRVGSVGGMRAQNYGLNDRACGGEIAELGIIDLDSGSDSTTALGLGWTSDFSLVE